MPLAGFHPGDDGASRKFSAFYDVFRVFRAERRALVGAHPVSDEGQRCRAAGSAPREVSMAVTTAADGWVSFWTDQHLGSGEGIGGYAAFVAASLIVGFAANVPQGSARCAPNSHCCRCSQQSSRTPR